MILDKEYKELWRNSKKCRKSEKNKEACDKISQNIKNIESLKGKEINKLNKEIDKLKGSDIILPHSWDSPTQANWNIEYNCRSFPKKCPKVIKDILIKEKNKKIKEFESWLPNSDYKDSINKSIKSAKEEIDNLEQED